jgi:putative ABC transport system permease protein
LGSRRRRRSSTWSPQALAAEHPDANAGRGVRLMRLVDSLTAHVSTRLWFLLAAAGCVLLVVCANVANLLLTHASGRRRELAIRSAIGATRMHLFRQALTEGLVVAWAGGALGLLLAAWALPSLVALAPPDIPRLAEIGIDRAVLFFTLAAATVVGIACALAAAAFVDYADPGRSPAMRVRSGAVTSRRVRQGLILAEVALALMLVIAAGLLVRTMRAVGALELGFEPRNVLAVGLAPDMRKYKGVVAKARFESDLVTRVRELPAVVAAGIGSRPLLGGGGTETRISLTPDGAESTSSS